MGVEPLFGRTVRDRRRALDLTQEELARRVGCAAVTLRKVEYGDLRPSRQIAERLAVALAVPLDGREAFIRAARAVQPAPRTPAASLSPSTPVEPPTLEELVARGVRGYQLGAPLGSGGFGAVYHAVQPLVEREVAVKIILPQHADLPEFVRRFEAEARLIARLEHPHIVPLYDYWREPGVAFLVMRLLRGGSLQARLAQGGLAPAEVLGLLEQVGAALQFAHRAGVIHRDLKPANILFDEGGNAYLADFGIAKDLATPGDELSFAGAFVGSPAYSSPEQIRAEAVSPQTDIYALGVLIYEALAGERPFPGPTSVAYIQQHLGAELPALAAHLGLPLVLDRVLQRAAAKVPTARYPDVGALLADLRGVLFDGPPTAPLSLQQPTAAAPPTVVLDLADADNPYQGLRPFAEADAAAFFGRAALVQQLLTRLGEPSELARFLAVVGPSGSGKSSAVRAGLIPALRAGALPGSERWYVVDLVPGATPLVALTHALLRVAPAGVGIDDLLPLLQADRRGLLRAARRVLPHGEQVELVLLIDQFEELFTLVADEPVRAHLLENLIVATLDEHSPVRVIVTLRADLVDRPLQYVDFGELLKQRNELVLPLTADELEQAILGPARRVGLALEEGLTVALIGATLGQPGALPLLQHTLSELFARREGCRLTLAAYDALGRLVGALMRSADARYEQLSPAGQQAARQLLLHLVTPGEGAEDTRRRARRSELDFPEVEEAIQAFTATRLLTLGHDPLTREGTVEVAHEALITGWPRLRGWLDTSREYLRVQRRLAAAAAEWAGAERNRGFLATGARLSQFEALAEGGDLALTAEEQAYLAASLAERDRQLRTEQERQQRELAQALALAEEQRVRAETEQRRASEQSRAAAQLRRRAVSLAGALALALLAALSAGLFARSAQANYIHAEAQRLAAEANALFQAEGNVEVIALLAIRSLNTEYTPQGDAALQAAATLDYPLQILSGHEDALWDVSFSPDGQYLLTSSFDRTARLWDARTGEELRVFRGHTDGVTGAVFAPDGQSILTGSSDGTARSWDVQTGEQRQVFQAERRPGVMKMSVAFSPDGRYVLAKSGDETVRLWDARTGEELRRFGGHADRISSVAFSPDGRMVLTGSWDKTARLWDAQTGEVLRTFSGHSDAINSVAFSPDGRMVLTGSFDQTARLWDAQTGEVLRTFSGHSDFVHRAQFSPDGRYVLTGSDDASARLWDVTTGAVVRQFRGHTASVWSVAMSPDGRSVLTGSLDGTARLWSVEPVPSGVQFGGHDGPLLANTVAVSRDGAVVLTGAGTTARLWDARTGVERRRFTHPPGVTAIALSADRRLVLAGGADGVVLLWDADSGELLRTLVGHGTLLTAVAFTSNGAYIASGDFDGVVRLWETATGRELRTFNLPTGLSDDDAAMDSLHDLSFSPDDRQLLTGSGRGRARLWDVQSGELRRTFRLPSSEDVFGVAFSPDGRLIALSSSLGIVRLWETESGQERRSFSGHANEVWGLDFSPDGRTLLSGGIDGTARLWDVVTGTELRRFNRQPAAVYNAVMTPDGQSVLLGDSTGQLQLYARDYQEAIRSLCDRLGRDLSADERIQYGIANAEPTCQAP